MSNKAWAPAPGKRDGLQGGRLSLNLPKPSLHWGPRSSTTSCRSSSPEHLSKDARLGPRGRMGRQPTLRPLTAHIHYIPSPHTIVNTPTCAGRGEDGEWGEFEVLALHNQVSRSRRQSVPLLRSISLTWEGAAESDEASDRPWTRKG